MSLRCCMTSVLASLKVDRVLEKASQNGGQLTEGSIMVQCPQKGPGTGKVLMLKTEDWSFLRRLHLQEGKSARWISENFKMSRKTVAKYLREESPPKYKQRRGRISPVLEPYKAIIVAILESDKKAPAKQRHTGRRIYERLVAEHGFKGGQSTVRTYVGILRQAGGRPNIYLPLDFAPGHRGQVDFGEIQVCVGCAFSYLPMGLRDGQCDKRTVRKVQCFVMRLCYSRRIFAMSFPSANIPGFVFAHRKAFEYFGSRPESLVYDNLSLAVTKVLSGRDRKLTNSFEQLLGHYGFGYHFCQPGEAGVHEKGGVEGGIGFLRRNWFVPMVHVKDFEELNNYLLRKCEEDSERTIAGQACKISEAWATERALKEILDMGATEASLVQSLLVSSTRPIVDFSPLDLSERLALSDYEVIAVDIVRYEQLTGEQENDREPAA